MEELDRILARRASSTKPWYRVTTIIAAIGLHVIFLSFAILAPEIFAEREPPPEFVAVTIVPAAALGQIEPPPPAPEPQKPTPTLPEPESEKAPPPAPEKKREEKEAPPPAPSTQRRERPAETTPTPLQTTPTPLEPRPRQGSPRGNPLATGGPAEITGFDDPDFTYSYYADQLLSRIRAVWERPPIGGDVQMTISFRIDQKGHVSDVRIVASSGYNSFDRAGLRAVQIATLPPLPKSYRKDSLGVRLIIH